MFVIAQAIIRSIAAPIHAPRGSRRQREQRTGEKPFGREADAIRSMLGGPDVGQQVLADLWRRFESR